MRSELFKTALQNYKDELAKCLQEGGEGKRVSAFLEKIDHQIPLSQHMFDVAWNHRQTEVDELQKRVDSLEKAEFKLAQVKAILQNNPKLLESILVKKIEQALKGGES